MDCTLLIQFSGLQMWSKAHVHRRAALDIRGLAVSERALPAVGLKLNWDLPLCRVFQIHLDAFS